MYKFSKHEKMSPDFDFFYTMLNAKFFSTPHLDDGAFRKHKLSTVFSRTQIQCNFNVSKKTWVLLFLRS